MTVFKGSVYWKDQCKFCKSWMCCKYREAVELLMARLLVVELESANCYGSLSFWCDYYQENPEAIKDQAKERGEVVER